MNLASLFPFFSVFALFWGQSGFSHTSVSNPYWIQLNYIIGAELGLTDSPQIQNITIAGYPRTRRCEFYSVQINSHTFTVDNKKDLDIVTNYIHDELMTSRFVSGKLTNNIGFSARSFSYIDGWSHFQKALDLLVSISRLNAIN